MAAERLAPDAIAEQSNLSGSVQAVVDDPDAPDGSWLTAADTNADSIVRVTFPTPTGSLTGTQEFRALVRKVGGSGTPTARIELYDNGVLVSTPLADTNVTTSTVLSGSWSGSGSGSTIECRVYGTKSGGSPSARAAIEVGAIEWNAEYSEPVPGVTGTGSVSFGHASAGSGAQTFSSSGAVSFGYSVSGAGTYTPQAIGGSGSASFTAAISGSGSVATAGVSGSGGVSFGFASSSSGAETFSADGGATFGASFAGTGAQSFIADGGVSFGASLIGSGTVTTEGFAGAGGVAFGFALDAAGTYTPAAVSGSGAASFAYDTSATGTVTAGTVTGSAALTFGFALAGSAPALDRVIVVSSAHDATHVVGTDTTPITEVSCSDG